MANKMVLILIAAAVAVIIAGAAVTIPSFTQDPAGQNNTSPQKTSSPEPGSVLKLSSANVPLNIPLIKGYENENEIFFIGTDVSNEEFAAMGTNWTGFKVNHAPLLAQTPEDARGQVYIFENGIKGGGPLGFQAPVTNAKPGDEGYSPLQQINFVRWADESVAVELRSVAGLMEHESMGHLSINQTGVVANHPAVKWNGGSLQIRQDRDSINDQSPYIGGQVLDIDTEKMLVSMVAHRGWGPDGKTIFYIVTDATPEMPGTMMGVPFVSADEKLAATPVAVDLFQFTNGINGTGPMGFQPGIGGANPDDENYSPMWRISFITWKDPSQARVLETQADINRMLSEELITIEPAMEGKHVVNCPFFDQQTVFEHMGK
ncbi:MAG TPA: hypothetical protein VJM08_04035 [Anaerolineales bacterium]|nr:hypothetical protein [Anaerolineales bacterium]